MPKKRTEKTQSPASNCQKQNTVKQKSIKKQTVKAKTEPKKSKSQPKPKGKQQTRSTNLICNSKSTAPSSLEESKKLDEIILFGDENEKLSVNKPIQITKKSVSTVGKKVNPFIPQNTSQKIVGQKHPNPFKNQAESTMPQYQRGASMVHKMVSDTQYPKDFSFGPPNQNTSQKESSLSGSGHKMIRTSNQSATRNFIYERYLNDLKAQKNSRISRTPDKKVSWIDHKQVIEFNQEKDRDSKSDAPPYRPMTTIQNQRPQYNLQDKKAADIKAQEKYRTTTYIGFVDDRDKSNTSYLNTTQNDKVQTSDEQIAIKAGLSEDKQIEIIADPSQSQVGQKRPKKSKSTGKKASVQNLDNLLGSKLENKRQVKIESKAKQAKRTYLFDQELLDKGKEQFDQHIKSYLQQQGDESQLHQYEKEMKAMISKLQKIKYKPAKM